MGAWDGGWGISSFYATLDGAAPLVNGGGCQEGALGVPEGWEIAADDETSRRASAPSRPGAKTCTPEGAVGRVGGGPFQRGRRCGASRSGGW